MMMMMTMTMDFAGVAKLQLVALVGVQVLHVSGETER